MFSMNRDSQWDASRRRRRRRNLTSCQSPQNESVLRTSTRAMISLLGSNVTKCDGNESTENIGGPSSQNPPPRAYQIPSDQNPYKDEIVRMQQELDEEQCKVCMYTGVAVCTGLSLYFIKLATDDSTLKKNRRFLYVCSAGSMVAGIYRWYLG